MKQKEFDLVEELKERELKKLWKEIKEFDKLQQKLKEEREGGKDWDE